MAKKTPKRVTAKKLRDQLPKTSALAHTRAKKMAEPFIDEMQRAVDEETERAFGIKPDPKRAAEFRKRVSDIILKGKK